MTDIGNKYCKKQGEGHPYYQVMERVYHRIKGVFKAFGWRCPVCRITIEDEIKKPVEEKKSKRSKKR